MTAAISSEARIPQPRRQESDAVTVTGDVITIKELQIRGSEPAAIVAAELAKNGPTAATALIARALPVGLLATAVTTAGIDSGAVQRTLDNFASGLDVRSQAAIGQLQAALERTAAGEKEIAETAERVLAQLPQQLEKTLAGEAASVHAAVVQAAQEVQSSGITAVQRALAQYSEQMRAVLSLDNEGPVQMLRKELIAGLASTRQELSTQLGSVQQLLAATQAAQTAGAKSSRQIGKEFEQAACDMAREIAVAAGDIWSATGDAPAPGTTRRTGDGVSVVSKLLTGGAEVRIVIEAKKRSRPLSVSEWRKELAAAKSNRHAIAALGIVPDTESVPDGTGFCRIGEREFVVAMTGYVDLVYRVLRELAIIHSAQSGHDNVDTAKIESNIRDALSGLTDLNELGRLIQTALNTLTRAKEIGGRTTTRIKTALDGGLTALRAQ